MGYEMISKEGTIAAYNMTYESKRIMDGIRLTSVNNSGAVGDIIEGGIGYDYAIFMLVGHSNYYKFYIDAFENYTSSLVTPTTPIPNKIIHEWGTINYASNLLE